jgi:hypothetical protein
MFTDHREACDSLEAELDGLAEAFEDMKEVVLNVALYLMTKGACPLVAAAMLLSNEFPDRIMLPGSMKKAMEDRLRIQITANK